MRLRIPLIRFGKDDTPYVAWEWLFYPIVIVLITLGFVLFCLVAIPYSLIWAIAMGRRERKTRRTLIASGRFLPQDELKVKLESGNGTLIVVQESPKAIREWWTDDDVIGSAPSPLPAAAGDCKSDALISFAKTCLARYTDHDTGAALLTDGTMWLVDSAVAAAFPRAKIVTISTWLGDPRIAKGHVEDMLREMIGERSNDAA